MHIPVQAPRGPLPPEVQEELVLPPLAEGELPLGVEGEGP